MQSLIHLQQQFMKALQTGEITEIADEIDDQGLLTPEFRINLYRTAYFLRLKQVLETDHEILGYFLGDSLFDQMAEQYIGLHPSKYKSLRNYGEALPLFLENTRPFSEHPIISEIAKFERLLLTAFDAPNAQISNQQQLLQIPDSNWPYLTFRFHPSVQFYSSQWNAVAVWQAIKQKQTPPNPTQSTQNWIIWRNNQRLTEFSSLNSLQHKMFNHFLNGANYAQVCDLLAEEIDINIISESSIHCILEWLNQGIISNIVY